MKFIYFSILISLFSCSKKSSNYVLKGTIYDSSLNSLLANASISLYKQLPGNSYETLISSTTSDSDGNYSFNFGRDKSEKYTIKISKVNYFSIDEIITVASLSVGTENNRNYSLSAKSWVKLHFKNIDPHPEDIFRFMKQQGKVNCTECCPSSYQYLYGVKDTSIYCANDGNTTYSYIYAVIGTTNQDIKSVITPPFDTTELYIEY